MSDDDGITLEAREWTVSASEKVSTGEYENYNPHVSVSGELPAPESELDEDTRADLKEELLCLHGDLQDVINKAAGNRIAEPEFETWTFQDDPGPEVKEADELEGQTDG